MDPEKNGLLSSSNRPVIISLFLIVATVALYYPVHNHPFANYDDQKYILENGHIRSGLNWPAVSWAFSSYYESNWHPLTWLSHAADYQLFQLNPRGHHDVNLAFHAANALLVFLVLWRATGGLGPSFMTASLFALHALNVESVAWIAERKNLLSLFFFLLALGSYTWYARRQGIGRYVVVAVVFAFGLMAKPQIITLPFVLLLWDYWPLGRITLSSDVASSVLTPPQRTLPWLVLEKLPLLALSAASAVITVRAQRAGGAVASLQQHPLTIRIENAICAYGRYVGKTFWPSRLSPMYPYPSEVPALQVAAALLGLLVITALVIRYRQHRYLLVGWLWFLGTLAPMIGLVQVGSQAMADRYAYLPCIGLFFAVCWGAAEISQQRNFPAAVAPVVSIVILLGLTITARRQLDYWGDNVTLWAHAIEVTAPNYIAEDNLGAALLDRGLLEPAMQHFQAASSIYPADPTSLYKIAMYEQQRENWPAAIEEYSQLLGVASNAMLRAAVLTNLGYVYLDDHDSEGAWTSWQQAVTLDANSARAWIGLGVIAERSGDINLAIRNYTRGIEIQPSDVGYLLLAQVLEQGGRKEESRSASEQATRLTRNLADAERVAGGLLGH